MAQLIKPPSGRLCPGEGGKTAGQVHRRVLYWSGETLADPGRCRRGALDRRGCGLLDAREHRQLLDQAPAGRNTGRCSRRSGRFAGRGMERRCSPGTCFPDVRRGLCFPEPRGTGIACGGRLEGPAGCLVATPAGRGGRGGRGLSAPSRTRQEAGRIVLPRFHFTTARFAGGKKPTPARRRPGVDSRRRPSPCRAERGRLDVFRGGRFA